MADATKTKAPPGAEVTTGNPVATPPSFTSLFRRGVEKPRALVGQGKRPPMPPARAGRVLPTRQPRPEGAPAPVDLTGQVKVWMEIGPGGSGKTKLARVFGAELSKRNLLAETAMVAADPGPRALTTFFETVDQPETADPGDTTAFLLAGLAGLRDHPTRAIIDFGGNNTSLSAVLDREPRLAQSMEAAGAHPVAAYFWTPRTADVSTLEAFEAAGFQPKATVMILNLATADSPSAFDGVRGDSAYQAALKRGAVEVFLPALEEEIALHIESHGLSFRAAAEGKAEGLSDTQARVVAEWMAQVVADFDAAGVASWLPWN